MMLRRHFLNFRSQNKKRLLSSSAVWKQNWWKTSASHIAALLSFCEWSCRAGKSLNTERDTRSSSHANRFLFLSHHRWLLRRLFLRSWIWCSACSACVTSDCCWKSKQKSKRNQIKSRTKTSCEIILKWMCIATSWKPTYQTRKNVGSVEKGTRCLFLWISWILRCILSVCMEWNFEVRYLVPVWWRYRVVIFLCSFERLLSLCWLVISAWIYFLPWHGSPTWPLPIWVRVQPPSRMLRRRERDYRMLVVWLFTCLLQWDNTDCLSKLFALLHLIPA